jgi:hypothetical protein
MEPLRACSAWYLWPLGGALLRARYTGYATVGHRVRAYGVPVEGWACGARDKATRSSRSRIRLRSGES